MRTDGIFTVHQVDIKTKFGDAWQLVPFGDIHRDSPSCSESKWKEFCDHWKGQKNALFLGMGDYTDGYSGSERMVIYSGAMHESSRKREEREGRKRIEALAKEIEWMKGRCIGLLGGNHFQQYMDGTTGDQYLASLLGARYLGACSAIRMSFHHRSGKHSTACVDVFAHHGKGGGATAGGRMNNVEKLSHMCDADIFLMGDNHARGVLPLGNRLRLTTAGKAGVKLRHRESWIGRTGSFLRGYVPNESNYVTDAALPPANLGWISFSLVPYRDRVGGGDFHGVKIGAHQ